MVHILLILLKIIGMIIGAIAGLILVFLLALLFVPVRYHGRGKREEKILKGQFTVSWLLHLIHFRFRYSGEIPDAEPETELFVLGLPVFWLKRFFNEKTGHHKAKTAKVKKEETSNSAMEYNDFGLEEEEPESEQQEKMKTVLFRIVDKLKSLRELPGRFGRAINKIWLTIKEVCGKIRKWNQFVRSNEFSAAKSLVWKELKQLLGHIAPVRIQGYVHFGFDDPSITGKILGGIALFYPILPKNLSVIPDFENNILEGNLDFKGRIYGIFLVKVFCIVWFNKNIQILKKQLKEA